MAIQLSIGILTNEPLPLVLHNPTFTTFCVCTGRVVGLHHFYGFLQIKHHQKGKLFFAIHLLNVACPLAAQPLHPLTSVL